MLTQQRSCSLSKDAIGIQQLGGNGNMLNGSHGHSALGSFEAAQRCAACFKALAQWQQNALISSHLDAL